MTSRYIGRFAPSPSGPLHFGSLVTAVGSYLQARSQQGRWLVRIEDIDPPREQTGAAELILKQLHAFGMTWDDTPRYQSQQHQAYQSQIDQWLNTGEAYYCQCTRQQIKAMGGIYRGECQDLNLKGHNCAIRLRNQHGVVTYPDILRGTICIPTELAHEDMIIRRRDGLYAYNLAVVLDDIDQGITEIVRGADLLEPTGRQCAIYRTLDAPEPNYLHLPLVQDRHGQKLSKQNHAPALDARHAKPLLHQALAFLGHNVPPSWHALEPQELLHQMAAHWTLKKIPIKNAMIAAEGFSFGGS
jgi:glutamyl-Q tRNA(Asp) synthetase